MRLYYIYIVLLVTLIVLQLTFGKNTFADVNLEGYDMTKVEILDSPFWCTMTPKDRTAAIDSLTQEQKRVALNDGTEKPFAPTLSSTFGYLNVFEILPKIVPYLLKLFSIPTW